MGDLGLAVGGALEPIVHAGTMSGRRKTKVAAAPQSEPPIRERAASDTPQGDGQKEPRRSRRTSTVLESRIGYRFADVVLLTSALTHISALKGPRNRASSYQRMEFLGDHVLGLVISDMLYRGFPKADEGELSRRLADLVRKETCAEIALTIELGAAIKLGSSEVNAGARKRPAILADVCEALIGAVFLDGGYPAAEGLVERLWHERMQATAQPLRDPKTILQEWAQARGLPTPIYKEVSHINRKDLARSYRLLVREMDLKMPVPDPARSVAKIASKVEAGESTRRRALEILARAKQSGVAAGKDPVGLAASALYVASTLSGEGKTQRDIAKAAGVTEVTIRNRYKNLRNALGI